jgi:hypothetical protein
MSRLDLTVIAVAWRQSCWHDLSPIVTYCTRCTRHVSLRIALRWRGCAVGQRGNKRNRDRSWYGEKRVSDSFHRRTSHDAKAKTSTPTDAATIPHGCARPAVGNRQAIGGQSSQTVPPNTHQSAETLCDDAPTTAKPGQTDACGGSGYCAECQKRAFEFPIL